MDILSFYEFRKDATLAAEDSAYPVYLGAFFGVDINLVSVFRLAADILFQKVEILVEPRLGGDMESLRIRYLLSYRNLEEYPFEGFRAGEKLLILIKIWRVQPQSGGFREDGEEVISVFTGLRQAAAYYIHLGAITLGNLGIAVEDADGFHFVSPEGNAVRLVVGIRENIYQGTPDGELTGRGNKIHPFETGTSKSGNNIIEGYFLAFFYLKDA